LSEVAVSNAPAAAVTPIPLRVTIPIGAVCPLSVTVRFPLAVPGELGAKVTLAVALLFAGTMSDVGVTANGAFALRVTVPAAPVLVKVTVCAALVCPTFTIPKLSGALLTEIMGLAPLPEPGMVSVPGPVMLKVPPPDPVVPAPVPDAVALKLPVAPAKPPVPPVMVTVAGPLSDGFPAKTCASSVNEPDNKPVRVPVGLPLVIVIVTGAEPDAAEVIRLKFELNVPVPTPDRVTVPVAETLPLEVVPLPVIVRVPLIVPPVVAATAVPLNCTKVGLCAVSLLVMFRVPFTAPAVVGVNARLTVVAAPGCTVKGIIGEATITAVFELTI